MEPAKTITAEQLFWGHNGLEYQFLSGERSPYASEVERLCVSVGTPDGRGQEQFLLSVPYKDKLIWGMCCNVRQDKSNRPTLFFHILIVNLADVQRLGINAFDVWESNGFSTRTDSSPTKEICVSSRYSPKSYVSSLRVIDDRVIISNHPEPDAVFQRVQSNVNQIPWATYSYRFMNQMEVSVLSDKASAPDFSFPQSPDSSVNVQNEKNNSAPSAIMKKLFIGSLILNIVLLLGYFVLPGSGSTNSNGITQELRDKLPKEPLTNVEWDNLREKQLKALFKEDNPNQKNMNIIETYIHFVNDNFFQERNEK